MDLARVGKDSVKQFEVYLCDLEPSVDSEIRKVRPVAIVSPNEMMRLRTIVTAPLTTTIKGWPSRIAVRFRNRDGEIALDQIRTVDKSRLRKRLGRIDEATAKLVCARLCQMFEYINS